MKHTTQAQEHANEAMAVALVGALQSMYDRGQPDDRARLARLRRGLGQPRPGNSEVDDVVQGLLTENAPDWIEETLYLIGPLFALHPLPFSGPAEENMGHHFRTLVDGEALPAAVERRFVSLLASEPEDLADALRAAVTLLRGRGVAVNWQRLFLDTRQWLDRGPQGESKRRKIRLRWSRALWRLSKNLGPMNE